jgi:cytoskeletal protein RodZ
MRRREALPDPEIVRGLRELDAALAAEPTADPDLALLVADVAAARPEADAAFLATLDSRVHAGFPQEAKRRTKRPWHARLRQPHVLMPGLGIALAAALVVVVSSGGGGSNDNDTASSSSRSTASTPLLSTESKAQLSGGGSAGASSADSATTSSSSSQTIAPAAATPSAPSPDRKVQRAADLTLTPEPADVQSTADGVVRETQAAGGYVQQSTISTRDGGGSASFTLRIPTAHLDDTLAQLSKLAHVGALNQSATDITSAFDSASAQLSDARAERTALLRALGKATTDRQIASLKARLADNRLQIALREKRLDVQRRAADLATVAVTVQGTGKATKKGGGAWTPRDALHDAGRVLEVAGGVLLIAAAALAPLALLAALALLGARVLRRRRREGALDGTA